MEILLSIKPEYSERIFSGEKKYEFRKKPPNKVVKKAYIYESNPSKYIVGWISIKKILSGSPKEIWDKCKNQGGINEKKFFAYCENMNVIHALEIDGTFQFDFPIDPYEINETFKPPQNFYYISDFKLNRTLEDRDINE